MAEPASGDREIFFLHQEDEADIWVASFEPERRD